MARQDQLARMKQQAKRQQRAAKKALIRNPRVQFANWLKIEHPNVYGDALIFAQSNFAQRLETLSQAAKVADTSGDLAEKVRANVAAVSAARAGGISKAMMQRMQAQAAGVTEGDQLGFLDWGNTGLVETAGATDTKSFWSKFAEGALAAGTTYLTLKNQRDAMKINLERAQIGQPPIDMATSAPVIRTVVEVEPATARALASDVGAGINKTMLVVGGVALVAMFFLMR